MQRSINGKYCWYHGKLFVQMIEDGNTQYWKDCDVSDAERLPQKDKEKQIREEKK